MRSVSLSFSRRHTNRGRRVYSTATAYFSALNKWAKKEGFKFPTYFGDFLPFVPNEPDRLYGLQSQAFSSRSDLKGVIRQTSSLVRAADLFFVLGTIGSVYAGTWSEGAAVEARRAVALAQHHETVDGTARASVLANITARLEVAAAAARLALEVRLSCCE